MNSSRWSSIIGTSENGAHSRSAISWSAENFTVERCASSNISRPGARGNLSGWYRKHFFVTNIFTRPNNFPNVNEQNPPPLRCNGLLLFCPINTNSESEVSFPTHSPPLRSCGVILRRVAYSMFFGVFCKLSLSRSPVVGAISVDCFTECSINSLLFSSLFFCCGEGGAWWWWYEMSSRWCARLKSLWITIMSLWADSHSFWFVIIRKCAWEADSWTLWFWFYLGLT
jgi:hypothetical protein